MWLKFLYVVTPNGIVLFVSENLLYLSAQFAVEMNFIKLPAFDVVCDLLKLLSVERVWKMRLSQMVMSESVT